MSSFRDSEPIADSVQGIVPTAASSKGTVTPLQQLPGDSSHLMKTVSTQTLTWNKPSLSIQDIPIVSFQPVRRKLGFSKTVTTDFYPTLKVDKTLQFASSSIDKCSEALPVAPLVVDQGTSPSIPFTYSPEPPAKAVTQGPSFSPSPGLSGLPSGSAAQALSSSSFPLSPRATEGDDDSEAESEPESVILADPSDPSTELRSASESFSLLKKKIVEKYVEVKEEKKVVERSSFQAAFEKEKPKTAPFKLTQAVRSRLAAIDEELVDKRASSSAVTVFSPYLKNKDFKYYLTEVKPEFEAQPSVLAAMSGVLDQTKVKRFKKTKVSFKITELDSIFKSAFRALEIWSYASSSFEVLGDCFLELRSKLPEEHKDLAIKYASLLRCIDKAGRHGIGETANIVSNLMLKKREHIMSLSNASVPLSTKTEIIFAPIAECKLLPAEHVKAATTSFRQQTETSALVAVAAASKASSSRSSLVGSNLRGSYASPLQDRRYRLGRVRGGGKASKKLFLRNREYFNRRDRAARGRGQGRPAPAANPNQN